MDPVGQISAQRPQYMHLQISISKWLNDRCFVSLFISIPIVIQVIGQTRSQARQPVQISDLTAIHAFTNINIKMAERPLFRLLVHLDPDRDTSDRADPLAGKTARADIRSDRNTCIYKYQYQNG